MFAGRRSRLCRASPAGARSGKHAEICRRRDAVGVRHILDRRRSGRGLAGSRFRHRCFCGAVPGLWPRGRRLDAASARGGLAMNMLGAVFRELIGLFVDDGWLALEIVAVVVLAAISATLLPDMPLGAGGILFFCFLGGLL